MAALTPVPPGSVTDSSIVRSVCAVGGLTTWMPAGCWVVVTAPSGWVTDCTMRGGMRTPLLAMVW